MGVAHGAPAHDPAQARSAGPSFDGRPTVRRSGTKRRPQIGRRETRSDDFWGTVRIGAVQWAIGADQAM